jgi:predicted house-cleaning noncanonical NTP pyrophosphatase (MazG superfamily)
MDTRLKLTEETLNSIIDNEARKTVGHILKQYELIEDKKLLKVEIKEILYQSFRNVRDMVRAVGKEAINLTIQK